MPDIAKKTRVIKAQTARSLNIRNRNLFCINQQIEKLQRQVGYCQNLYDEVKDDFFNVRHDYTPEYREHVNMQLLTLETMKTGVLDAIENLKKMKILVKNGNF